MAVVVIAQAGLCLCRQQTLVVPESVVTLSSTLEVLLPDLLATSRLKPVHPPMGLAGRLPWRLETATLEMAVTSRWWPAELVQRGSAVARSSSPVAQGPALIPWTAVTEGVSS